MPNQIEAGAPPRVLYTRTPSQQTPLLSEAAAPVSALPGPRTLLLRQGKLVVLGALLGAGQMAGGAAPFGLALVLGAPAEGALAAALGALAGSLPVQPIEWSVRLAVTLVAVLAVRRLLPGRFRVGAAAAMLALVGQELFAVLAAGGTLSAMPLLSGGLAVLLGAALHRWPMGRPAGNCICLGLAAAAVQVFGLPVFAPGLAAAGCAVLAAASVGTPQQTMLLSLVLAGAVSAASPNLCASALAVALGGLGAALFGEGERRRSTAAFVLGCAAGSLFAPGIPIALFTGAGAGVLAFWCLPDRMLYRYFPEVSPKAPPQSLGSAARRLNAVAEALNEIAETVDEVCARAPQPEGFDFVVEYAARQACGKCKRRAACWGKQYSTLVDGIYHLKPALEETGRADGKPLPGQLSCCGQPGELCAAATRGFRVWRSSRQTRADAVRLRSVLNEQYTAMAAALQGMAEQLGRTGLPDPHREQRVQQLFASLGLDLLECSVTTDLAGRVTAEVTLPRTRFTGEDLALFQTELSRICRREFTLPDVIDCKGVTQLRFGERPAWRVNVGQASRPAGREAENNTETVSGDAVGWFCDTANRAQILLCDGMGTGTAAAVDGRLAVHLTTRLLQAGIAAQGAARLVNVAMTLKGAEKECGATLDLLTIDLCTGRAGLFKAGAVASFLVRAAAPEVPRVLEGASLPMGVCEAVNGCSTGFSLEEGDMVVLVSDGVLADGIGWVRQQLQLSAQLGHSPQQVADTLADGARARAEGSSARPDDITVVAVQLSCAQ